jgi:hypothetical protein
MHRSSRSSSLPSALLFLGIGISLVVTQTGCPGGAELENPDAWAGRFGGNSGGAPPATGGTGGGTTGGTMTGGSAGTGTTNWVLDLSTVVCPGGLNAATVITSDCGKTGCHKGTLAAANLDLAVSPMNVIAKNTKDVPAKYLAIQCSAPTEPYMECVPATCPPPGSALLVDSKNPSESWLLKKVHDTTNGCGEVMPLEAAYTADQSDRLACIEAIVQAIAALK